MKASKELEQIRQAIKTLDSLEEKETESFRIVILTLKQKESAIIKELVHPKD